MPPVAVLLVDTCLGPGLTLARMSALVAGMTLILGKATEPIAAHLTCLQPPLPHRPPENYMKFEAKAEKRATPSPRTKMLLEDPVAPTLARLAAPNLVVAVAQTAVAVADAWFVGQLGVAPLAALALVFPVQSLMTMMSAGAMGGGISSAMARALGAGDRERAELHDGSGRKLRAGYRGARET